MDKGERQLQELGIFVHGVLVAFHALGIIYNLRRKNTPETIMHVGAAAFSVASVAKHYRKVTHVGPAN